MAAAEAAAVAAAVAAVVAAAPAAAAAASVSEEKNIWTLKIFLIYGGGPFVWVRLI